MSLFTELKTKVMFLNNGLDVYFIYNNEMYKYNTKNIMKLKNEITLPYKVKFIGFSRANTSRVLSYLKNNDNEIFVNIVKNPISKVLTFEAIIKEKQKIKKK